MHEKRCEHYFTAKIRINFLFSVELNESSANFFFYFYKLRLCTVCGGRGHLASDCKQARPGTTHDFTKSGKRVNQENKAQLDSEYTALMAELGETTSAPIQIATPSLGSIGNSQMATHSVGGAEVMQAIEYNPEKGTVAGGKQGVEVESEEVVGSVARQG